jgi:DNA helicase-2/ATP-dependent DNA helicase PcrA
VFKFETNYRSVPAILELSNAAIRANRARFEKDLRAARPGGAVLPALVPLPDPSTQAAFLAQRMLELRDEGVPLEEMAVLYRAHFQSLEVQMELTGRGIPFQITSGLRFFEQAHVKDVAAFLRFVTNRRDEISFKRMAGLLPGIGAGSAAKLWQEWLHGGWAGREDLPQPMSDPLRRLRPPRKSEKHWVQLCHVLDELAPAGGLARPADMIYSVLEGVYDDYLRDSFDNYENRRADIEQLMQYAGGFEDALEFLGQLALLGSADGEPGGGRGEPDREAVTLSSVHQAKGLEWRVVFLIWLSDGMFPIGRVLEADDDAMLEEERRLFYVALTRAKDELYLTYPMINPKSYSGDIIQRPSRFLAEVPEELVEAWRVGDDWGSGEDPF